jgi:hypothetical protein
MSTFKYNATDPLELGGELQIRVREGQTFEVPEEYTAQFEADDRFTSSRVKNPDVVTGAIPVQPSADAPAAPTDPASAA